MSLKSKDDAPKAGTDHPPKKHRGASKPIPPGVTPPTTTPVRPLKPLIYTPPDEPLNILHQDDHILVLSKPAGLLSVPGKDPAHFDSLETRAKARFPTALLVHRLDMETSGVFIMAMNKEAQANLGKQFERRRVQKTYIARVWGHVADESGVIDLPLRCDWPNRPIQMVCTEYGKPAQTAWEVLDRSVLHPKPSSRAQRGDPAPQAPSWVAASAAPPRNNEEIKSTLIKLTPHTGRSHQLRVHMVELDKKNGGHPILGDDFYAHDEAFAAAERLCLHAQRLELFHPDGGKSLIFRDEIAF